MCSDLIQHVVVMTEAEFIILNYLQTSPDTWFARREIARRAVKRSVYEENQHWADAALPALVANKLADVNDAGLYRLHKKELFGKEGEDKD